MLLQKRSMIQKNESIQAQAKFDLIGSIAEELLEKNDEEQVACRINSVDVISKQVKRCTGQTSSTDATVISGKNFFTN